MAVQLALQDLAALQQQLLGLLQAVEIASADERAGNRAPILEALAHEANQFRALGQRLLKDTLPKVTEHQRREEHVLLAKQKLEGRIALVRKLGQTLMDCESELQAQVKVVGELLPRSDSGQRVSLDWIVQSGRKLSYTTHAPPQWWCDPFKLLDQDYALGPKFHYSYPTEAEMKRNLARVLALRQQDQQLPSTTTTTTTTTGEGEKPIETITEEAVPTATAPIEQETMVDTNKRAKLSIAEPPQNNNNNDDDDDDDEEEEEEEDDYLGDL
ncbi:hypothetical protein BASA81_012733 [Batrachochytrium salamandrivorans]|nr:hypothetical protein BASA81_012733 [Batrachochytrium salamandrivorans]